MVGYEPSPKSNKSQATLWAHYAFSNSEVSEMHFGFLLQDGQLVEGFRANLVLATIVK